MDENEGLVCGRRSVVSTCCILSAGHDGGHEDERGGRFRVSRDVASPEGTFAQQRDVADAIILERAARVLRRRHDLRDVGVPERIRFAVYTLDAEAQQLRGECNSV